MAEPVTQLDPARSTFIFITGKKGSGKSVLAQRLANSWPYDELVIDPTHDVVLDDLTEITTPLPVTWPLRTDEESIRLHFKPDVGSPTYEDDMDRAVGLALRRRRCLLYADEVGDLTRANKTPPNFRRALQTGRHYDLSMLMCGPRPIDVNPLCVSQADFVYVFKLPNPADRRRVADMIGWDPAAFDEAVNGLRGHAYLRFDARAEDEEDALIEFPPLPATAVTPTPRRR